jgi:hypothetical protein
VGRRKYEIEGEEVRSIYRLIKDVVVPLMTKDTARLPNGRRMIAEAVRLAVDKYIYVLGSNNR